MATRLANGKYHGLSWEITADGASVYVDIVYHDYKHSTMRYMAGTAAIAQAIVAEEIATYTKIRETHLRQNGVDRYSIKDGK